MGFFMLRLFVVAAMLADLGDSRCLLEAIFNFGDSNSDTGGFWAAFPPPPPFNGMTYFRRPEGRASDGRLIIDFIAGALHGPFLLPYLDSFGPINGLGPNFKYGANFATIGSTALPPNVSGLSPFHLEVQLNQMKRLKAQVDQTSYTEGPTNLPPRDIFGKSLYLIYIGQSDFTSNLATLGINGVKNHLPRVVSKIMWTIKELYALGGRTFLIPNIAPIGCFPKYLVELPHNNSDIDAFGCMISYNKAVQDYNDMLKKTVSKKRKQLSGSNIVYADTHAVLLELFQHPSSHGMKYGTRACCGHGGGRYNFNPRMFCGTSKMLSGQNHTATACSDPHNYVSWDGLHLTEAANKILANMILSGTRSEPPFEFHCAYD